MSQSSAYEAWRSALAEKLYTPQLADLPAYLDLEDDVLVVCATAVEPTQTHSPESAEAHLAQAVLPTIDVAPGAGPSDVLATHEVRSRVWRHARRGQEYDPWSTPPPALPLLAALSRAAEHMASDQSFAANNYYNRLVELLGLSPEVKDLLAQGVRRSSEALWDDLNTWLDDMGGSRGLPTAEAIGHRYVGLPISQALLRAADRAKFGEFFEDAGFAPGQSIALPDLEEYVAQWLKHGTLGPQAGLQSLKNMWRKPTGRAVLTQSLSTALALWDGSVHEGSGVGKGRGILLTARIARQGAFSPVRLHLSVALRGRLEGAGALPSAWEVVSSKDQPTPRITFREQDERYLVPDRRLDGVDNEGLLEGQLRLAPAPGDSTGAPMTAPIERMPRPVVVLVDMGSATFVEVDHAQMGEDHIVLVHEGALNPKGNTIFGAGGPHDVERILGEIAQPGFVRLDGATLGGVPRGWSVFRNATIMARLSSDYPALDPLVTAQTGTLSIGGGLRLPGLVRRWSTEAPLTITAALAEPESIKVTLRCVESLDDHPPADQGWTADEGQLVRSIGRLAQPGTYRLELRSPADSNEVRQSFTFHQVSADHPRVSPAEDEEVAPALPREVSPGSTAAAKDVSAEARDLRRTPIPQAPWWMAGNPAVKVVRAAEPEANGCAVTGAHHMHIETSNEGDRWNRGECTKCGLVKMYRTTPTKKKDPALTTVMPAPTRDPGELPAFAATEINGVAVLDALGWLGAGSARELTHVLRQAAADTLGGDELLRILESTGHVDVNRDRDMSIRQWSVAAKALAQTRTGEWSVVGAWGQRALRALNAALDSAGLGRFTSSKEDFIPVRTFAAELSAVEHVAAEVGARLMPDAGSTLLRSLRGLGSVGNTLPRIAADGVFDAEQFDLTTGRWAPCRTIAGVGAYRVTRGFSRQYLFRDSNDVAGGEAVHVTAQLAKHLAAQAHGRLLLAYSPGTKELFVPIGAELPGLYGRALTLLSGRPAARVVDSPSLVYRSVGQADADLLATLLLN